MASERPRISIDPTQPAAFELVRQVVLTRLRAEPEWGTIEGSLDRFFAYAEVEHTREKLTAFRGLLEEVFWEFVTQGVLVPSFEGLPHFHRTHYGKEVIEKGEYLPHDPTGYLDRLAGNVPDPDDTVLRYITESLNCFRRGVFVAATVMLGVAAERVFLLLCESFKNSLANGQEKKRFAAILEKRAMKPKLDWVENKIRRIQKQHPRPLPDNAELMVSFVYDVLRVQRNDYGHPQEAPPKCSREDAFVFLNMFPKYYAVAENVREYLSKNEV